MCNQAHTSNEATMTSVHYRGTLTDCLLAYDLWAGGDVGIGYLAENIFQHCCYAFDFSGDNSSL